MLFRVSENDSFFGEQGKIWIAEVPHNWAETKLVCGMCLSSERKRPNKRPCDLDLQLIFRLHRETTELHSSRSLQVA